MSFRKFTLFTKGRSDLLKEIRRKGSITIKEQKTYNSYLGFYFTAKILQDAGLLTCNGTTRNNEKIWKLTEKGEKFTIKLLEIEKLIGEMN